MQFYNLAAAIEMCAELQSYDNVRDEMAKLGATLRHTENQLEHKKSEIVTLTISAAAFEKARNELQFRYDTEKGLWVAEVASLKREVKFWRIVAGVATGVALAISLSH